MPQAHPGRYGAWVRYGGDPVSTEQIAFAARTYSVAILQPGQIAAATALKRERPDMVVLCYKCLSSTRGYEPGPIYTSGLSFAEAERHGEHVFAHRRNGARIEWSGYSGHWMMAVWDDSYQQRWIANVTAELRGSPWDGVMADNDIFDDYYGLRPPLAGGRTMAAIRDALDGFVQRVGEALNAEGRILVPNIAESRRDPGRWARHSAYGGGFEEVWLAYGADSYLPAEAALDQAPQMQGDRISIARIASDGSDGHPNFLYGLAAFWVFGGGGATAFTATAHDAYNGTPHIPEQDWDLGKPTTAVRCCGDARWRTFTDGFAAAHLGDGPALTVTVPEGMRDRQGAAVRGRVRLAPHTGVLLRRGDGT